MALLDLYAAKLVDVEEPATTLLPTVPLVEHGLLTQFLRSPTIAVKLATSCFRFVGLSLAASSTSLKGSADMLENSLQRHTCVPRRSEPQDERGKASAIH